jgi:anti-sigma factor RsiW
MADFVDVDALQRQLTERIEALDKQRKEQAEAFNREVAERETLASAERQQRVAEVEAANRRHAEKEAATKSAEELRSQAAKKAQIALENSLAAAEEARRLQEVKLAWLVGEINKQEFIEEQHSKAMQSAPVVVAEQSATAINVEHPVAPDNLGNAVQGTDGNTPSTDLMSDHLKMILRQAQRSY